MPKRESKFNISKDKSKRTYNGIVFDSVIEMLFYIDYIVPRLESGEILSVNRQAEYELQPRFVHNNKNCSAIKYISDFDVTYSDGKIVVIDIKGMVKPMDSIKRKMFNYRYPDIDLRWINFSKLDGGWVSLDVIKEGRSKRKKIREDKIAKK